MNEKECNEPDDLVKINTLTDCIRNFEETINAFRVLDVRVNSLRNRFLGLQKEEVVDKEECTPTPLAEIRFSIADAFNAIDRELHGLRCNLNLNIADIEELLGD
jgi:hypothetical protein